MRNDDLIKFVMLATINGLICLAVWQLAREQAPVIVFLSGIVLGAFAVPVAMWLKRWDQ